MDVAIYETHCGGEFDATNIIGTPIVTDITTIELDHVNLLGLTIEKIAFHKAGAFSSLQESTATTVLQQRAAEKQVMLKFVGIDLALPIDATSLKPRAQRLNYSLSLALVRTWLPVKAPNEQVHTRDMLTRGLKQSLPRTVSANQRPIFSIIP